MFAGKVVTRLDYQAYSKLAIRTMADIVRNVHNAHTRSAHQTVESGGTQARSLIRSAVHHRLGTVPVGEPSIVIAVSSHHRKEAFMACEQILEEVKLKAQIWKREFYEGEQEEDAEWKANVGH
ncbi:Molybdopterin biosynthesis MoaE [Dichomitus squalens]|nr:Molybdopterin biosynthesis MoaE [Dichomitus squalens]